MGFFPFGLISHIKSTCQPQPDLPRGLTRTWLIKGALSLAGRDLNRVEITELG